MNKNKVLFFITNLIIILTILYLSGFGIDSVYIGGDYSGFLDSKQIFENYNVWNNNTFIFNNFALIIKYSLFYFFEYIIGFSHNVSNLLGFCSIFMLGLYSTYIFLNYVGKNNISNYILFLFSYLYIFSLYFSIRFVDGHIDFMVFYYVFPLITFFIFKFLDTNNLRYGILSIIALIFLGNLYISPYILFFGVIFYWIIFILYKIKFNKRIYYKNILILILIFIFLSIPFILNIYFYKNSLSLEALGTDPVNMLINFANKVKFYDFFIGNGYWGLFDGFEGNLYYPFSNYKIFPIINLFILFSFGLIIYFYIKTKLYNQKIYTFGLYFLLIILSIEVFMFLQVKFNNIGFINNIINILPFFREPIAKVEGLFYFSLIFLLFLIFINIFGKIRKYLFILFIFFFTIINIYIFINSFNGRYSTNFISSKYLIEQKKIISNIDDRYLILPRGGAAICLKNTSKYCGVTPLMMLLKGEHYTGLAGGTQLKFIKNEMFFNFINKIIGRGINKIIIQKNYRDLVPGSEYARNMSYLQEQLRKKYNIIFSNENIDLIDLGNRNYFNFNGDLQYLSIDKISNVNYKLLLNFYGNGGIIFNDNFNKYWLFSKFSFENIKTKDYTNSWTISKQEIIDYVKENYSEELKKEGYPKKLEDGKLDYKYYTLNEDGSIDVELTLYFKPQMYFYIGLIISGTTFLLLILWLIIDSVKERRRKKEKAE